MPLSEPVPRKRIHTRTFECHGYQREDGLWDIEGRLLDSKTYSFENSWRGKVDPGTPVHEMWVRLTIDEEMRVHAAEAATDYAPFRICPEVAPDFAALAGTRIDLGWTGQVRRLFGGTKGCTHHVELIGRLGTVAYQTLVGQRRKKRESEDATKPRPRPRIIDTCYALASDSPVVREEFPDFYTGS
ncbi:MAG: DUF2889 domain-containing protein [Alphaproteobacteria bacterium]|nr:DUF2889 domain-containing protein [Alphaproteobacteria bacterium]